MGAAPNHKLTQIKEFRASRTPAPLLSTSCFTLSSSLYQPVVPTTIFALERMHAKMLSSTASGVVKSRTTFILLSRSEVKAEALGFSLPVSTETSWPRSRAISTTSEPVLPRPRTKIFMARKDFNRKGLERGGKDGRTELPRCSAADLVPVLEGYKPSDKSYLVKSP